MKKKNQQQSSQQPAVKTSESKGNTDTQELAQLMAERNRRRAQKGDH